jgi:ribonuclease HI
VGGTAVGGGTLVGLGKLILGQTQALKIQDLAKKGDLTKVDISVQDIVGGGIGIIPGFATASNFGKLDHPKPEDLALGICNLIGQTIAAVANFAAETYQLKQIVLTGKLTRVNIIVDLIKKTGKIYQREIIVPRHAGFVGALGAMVGAMQEKNTTWSIYSDGGARGNPGPGGCGVVIRDQTGKEVFRLKKYLGITTNNQAEYTALLFGLQKLTTVCHPKSIICYSDSQLMIRQLQGIYKVKDAQLKNLFLQIQKLVESIPQVTFKHIPREQNKEADLLANQAMDSGEADSKR